MHTLGGAAQFFEAFAIRLQGVNGFVFSARILQKLADCVAVISAHIYQNLLLVHLQNFGKNLVHICKRIVKVINFTTDFVTQYGIIYPAALFIGQFGVNSLYFRPVGSGVFPGKQPDAGHRNIRCIHRVLSIDPGDVFQYLRALAGKAQYHIKVRKLRAHLPVALHRVTQKRLASHKIITGKDRSDVHSLAF